MIPIVAFFDNKAGVERTSLVYHLAWMYRELGRNVLTVDLDPQAHLTAAFIDDYFLEEELWPDGPHPQTIVGAIDPLIRGAADLVLPPPTWEVEGSIHLIVGDLALARVENELSRQWLDCLDGTERGFRMTAAFWHLIRAAASELGAEMALVNVGPNLGAINRSALIAADRVVVPLAPELFSVQAMRGLGPTLREWRSQWQDRLAQRPAGLDIALPDGTIDPLGYVVLQHPVYLNRPVRVYDYWLRRIPGAFRAAVLDASDTAADPPVGDDPWALGAVKHYHSLIPMAEEARRPVFLLRSGHGAIGAHQRAVQRAYDDFRLLANSISDRLEAVRTQPS